MAAIDSSYQPKVGFEQGGEKLYVKSDGYFKFYDQDITGAQLKAVAYTNAQVVNIANSAGVLSVTTVPSYTRLVVFSIADAASNASARIPSCTTGQEIVFIGRGGSVGSVVLTPLSGVSIVGVSVADASSINFYNSAATKPFLRMIATADNEWSVIETGTPVGVNASS